MPEFAYNFWSRVDELLEKKRASVKDLAVAIDVSYDVVRQWRSKNRYPKEPIPSVIASWLGVTTEYLLSGNTRVEAFGITDEMKFVRDHQEARALIRAIMDDPALLYPISALVTRKAPEEKKEHA